MLKDVFKNIRGDSGRSMLGSYSGADFEDQISRKLKRFGFERYLPESDSKLKDYLQSIKADIQAKKGKTLLKNTMKDLCGDEYKNFFVTQPYGSQNYPDFLVFTEWKIFSIESKFVKENSGKPVWNGNLPKSDGIYIFGSYDRQHVTFFLGEDVLPEKERIKLLDIWEETDRDFNKWMRENKNSVIAGEIEEKYGFLPYVRKAYQQSQRNNENAVLDFFNNGDRNKLELSVIKYILDNDKDTE